MGDKEEYQSIQHDHETHWPEPTKRVESPNNLWRQDGRLDTSEEVPWSEKKPAGIKSHQ